MPGKGRKISVRGANKDGCVMPFHGNIVLAFVAGTWARFLSPTGLALSRILAEADAWAHFRMRSFSFRLHHGAITADYAAGFVGGVQDTPPATTAVIMELLPATYLGSTYTKPSDWVHVSKQELAGPFPWYKTIQGTADATEESPGYLVCAGSGATDTPVVEIRGVIEFKTSVAPANTPALVKLREEVRLERVREEQKEARKGLLRVLANAAPLTSG